MGTNAPLLSLCLLTSTSIRFAAPPERWQLPQPPAINRSSTISASSYGPQCPQSPASTDSISEFQLNDEDCLFANVYAPANASNLPVLVWIHGGGYGTGSGRLDLSSIINGNDNGFIGITIQYRVSSLEQNRAQLLTKASWVHLDSCHLMSSTEME